MSDEATLKLCCFFVIILCRILVRGALS